MEIIWNSVHRRLSEHRQLQKSISSSLVEDSGMQGRRSCWGVKSPHRVCHADTAAMQPEVVSGLYSPVFVTAGLGKEWFPWEELQQCLAKSCASDPEPELEVEAVPGHVAVLKGSAIRLRRPCFSEGHALLLNA